MDRMSKRYENTLEVKEIWKQIKGSSVKSLKGMKVVLKFYSVCVLLGFSLTKWLARNLDFVSYFYGTASN